MLKMVKCGHWAYRIDSLYYALLFCEFENCLNKKWEKLYGTIPLKNKDFYL